MLALGSRPSSDGPSPMTSPSTTDQEFLPTSHGMGLAPRLLASPGAVFKLAPWCPPGIPQHTPDTDLTICSSTRTSTSPACPIPPTDCSHDELEYPVRQPEGRQCPWPTLLTQPSPRLWFLHSRINRNCYRQVNPLVHPWEAFRRLMEHSSQCSTLPSSLGRAPGPPHPSTRWGCGNPVLPPQGVQSCFRTTLFPILESPNGPKQLHRQLEATFLGY